MVSADGLARIRPTIHADFALTRRLSIEHASDDAGAFTQADVEVHLGRQAPDRADADPEASFNARRSVERGGDVSQSRAAIDADHLETEPSASTRDAAHGNTSRPSVPKLILSNLRRDEAGAFDHLERRSRSSADRANEIANRCQRCLVEDEDRRVETTQPLVDQKRFHFVTVTRVPFPTFDSSSNTSTNRLLPDKPRPIDRAVL